MSNLRKWSSSASGNSSVAGGANTINFAEGQSPGSVNNSARELMAQVRGVYTPANWGWVEFSATASVASQTTFKIVGNQTTDYSTGRRVRLKSGSSTRYGSIVSSSYTTETTVTLTVDSGSLSASHSLVGVSVLDSNNVHSYYAVKNATNTFSVVQSVVVTDNTNPALSITQTGTSYGLRVAGSSGNSQFRAGTLANGYFEVTAYDTNPVYCLVAGANATQAVFGSQSNIPVKLLANNAEKAALDTSGNLTLTAGTGALGYGTGAGGTVTQLTSRTTAVTINKPCGQITLFTAAGTTSWTSFTVNNSLVTIDDIIVITQRSTVGNGYYFTVKALNGSFVISFASTGGTASDTPIFSFAILRSVTS